ncbi:Intracellular protein transport protein USO1 isoform 3 [Melia azedarach]|nr:Intracellular protein transport protein USO1 isoform 3 [Melia azedarach]
MRPRTDGGSRGQKAKNIQGEGPNWILIAGGALLSTLSVRLGYKLKQALDSKQQANANSALKGNAKISDRRRSPSHHSHTNMYSFTQDDDGCFNCVSGNEGMVEMKHPSNGQILSETDVRLPLVTVPAPEFGKENGVIWASSPDRLELPPKPFHHSNCSDSPCVSESGSDIFSKREVINKLRQQLKRRDDMILEMQDQIAELQNSLNSQLEHSAHLQSQLDSANKDLFDSEREIQRLRKAIADHCVRHVATNDKSSMLSGWPAEARNGHSNGYIDGESNFAFLEKGRAEVDKIEMLRKEVGELKEVIEGKDYLLQSYKEQKTELSMKIKELQQRLDSQLPNIL